ncbi:hypothetical protein FRX31_031174 [Thalictrum thalictroides]|uniref:Uncharacterized protein n=1 Tax=Thalictrum thalictroides TaxID=46969 RepID=A0A7J6V4S0_THATH|nr:hypothetical protein FRX31_031174 [Thalictrum thalictroides]
MKDSNESTALYVPSITTNNVSFSRGGVGGRRGGGCNGPNRGRNNNNNNSGGNRYAKPCDVCGLHNHTTSRCWDVIGKPSSQHRANTSVVVSEGSSSASQSMMSIILRFAPLTIWSTFSTSPSAIETWAKQKSKTAKRRTIRRAIVQLY